MFETDKAGILYTEHAGLARSVPGLASLWSYESRWPEPHRRRITRCQDGRQEYWLEKSDPLLNTILPGTGVSLVLTFVSCGRRDAPLPRPRCCRAYASLAPSLSRSSSAWANRFGRSAQDFCQYGRLTFSAFQACELVDRVVPLESLWNPAAVERLFAQLAEFDLQSAVAALQNELRADNRKTVAPDPLICTASSLIKLHGGCVSIEEMARTHGMGRHQLGRRFTSTAGLPPKLFARLTRFQTLVQALLSTGVSHWASASSATGFYEQAHMINEFRTFAGSPPTAFFRPYAGRAETANIKLRGRPSEW